MPQVILQYYSQALSFWYRLALNSKQSNAAAASNLSELKSPSDGRQARVLHDYDAANCRELSLLADEVITVYSTLGMDSNRLMGERGHAKGKMLSTYFLRTVWLAEV